MKIEFSNKFTSKNLVVFLDKKCRLNQRLAALDNELSGIISRAIKIGAFKGESGDKLHIVVPHAHQLERIILLGMKNDKLAETDWQGFGSGLVAILDCYKLSDADILVANASDSELANLAYGAALRNYHFDKYKSAEKLKDKVYIQKICFEESAKALFDKYQKTADAVHFARDLVSEPPNVIYPETLAKSAKELEKFGVKVEIFEPKELAKMGMGALLGVAQGSRRDARLVVMQYNGADRSKKPLAFVGKGVTFDTGGISIKPSNGMEDMKYDMAGSAVVIGTIRSLAARKIKVNAVGVIGCVENMPDGNAQRPSDVVRSMSGQTIEVLNTDAEGRLVLADVLWYCQQRFNPEFMVDLATLTGAIVISLGNKYAGLFSNNDKLSERLIDAGLKTGEKLWRFPLSDDYDKEIDSKIADVRNTQKCKGAGSITAAQFLQRFVNNKTWAHLDIAGVAWTDKNIDLCPEGATAFGVRLLTRMVVDHYEK